MTAGRGVQCMKVPCREKKVSLQGKKASGFVTLTTPPYAGDSVAATSVAASVWTLVALSIERYCAICHPLRSRKWQTQSHARRLIASIWIGGSSAMLPVLVLSELQPTKTGKEANAPPPPPPRQDAHFFSLQGTASAGKTGPTATTRERTTCSSTYCCWSFRFWRSSPPTTSLPPRSGRTLRRTPRPNPQSRVSKRCGQILNSCTSMRPTIVDRLLRSFLPFVAAD